MSTNIDIRRESDPVKASGNAGALLASSASPIRLRSSFRNRRRRGASLILILILMFLFALTAAMVMSVVGSSVRSAHVRTDQVEAFNMADSGVDLALAWLTQQSSPPDDTILRNMSSSFWGTNGTISAPFGLAGSTLAVNIYSDASNPGPTQKKYLVEAKATMPSGVTQIVRAYVRQVSFGKYAYFTVNDGAGFWDYNNHFEGPFHSDDGDKSPSTFLWTQTPTGGPIFTYNGSDAFSVSGDPTWWMNTIGNVRAPATTADFNAVASGGKATMTYGYQMAVNGTYVLDSNGQKIPNSPSIALPSTDYAQEYEALGLTPPNPASAPAPNLPTTTGAQLYSGGGIYIHGDNQMALSIDNSGNQVVTVTTAPTGYTQVQTITIYSGSSGTGAAMTTKKTATVGGAVTTTSTSVTTTLNGLIFSDGNITSLSGTVADNRVDANNNILSRNSMTIATDIAASKTITLSNSVKYNTARTLSLAQTSDTNFNQKAAILGLMAYNVMVQSGAPSTLEFDASIFCTGTFAAANALAPVGSAGVMTSIGGVIVHDAGIFAYANSLGLITSGYNEQYHYDQRLANNPPPYFPTTGSHYDVVSWQNVSATIQ